MNICVVTQQYKNVISGVGLHANNLTKALLDAGHIVTLLPDVKNRILYSLSQTRRELVRQESEYLGIMRKSEVNIAAREFIDYLKQAEKDGTIVINRSGDLIY